MKIINMRQFESNSNADIAADYPSDSVMVEVGSYRGQSAEKFMQSGNIKELHCVDAWRPYDGMPDSTVEGMLQVEKMFDERVSGYNVIKHKGTSEDVSREFEDESLDIVYIDAYHIYEAVKKDIGLWLPKIKPNGIISGHDYARDWGGVIRAVDEVLGKPHKLYKDTSWLFHKNEL